MMKTITETISFVKRNDTPNTKGLYAIRLRICKERQRKYFTLKIFADNKYWDADNECFVILKNVRDKKEKEEKSLSLLPASLWGVYFNINDYEN